MYCIVGRKESFYILFYTKKISFNWKFPFLTIIARIWESMNLLCNSYISSNFKVLPKACIICQSYTILISWVKYLFAGQSMWWCYQKIISHNTQYKTTKKHIDSIIYHRKKYCFCMGGIVCIYAKRSAPYLLLYIL